MKRRKLSHSPSDEEDAIAVFPETIGAPGGGNEALKVHDQKRLDDEHEASDEDDGDNDHETDGSEDEDPAGRGKGISASEVRSRTSTGNGTNIQHGRSPGNSTASSIALTGGAFKSNMFKLQVDELLGEVRAKRGRTEEAAEKTLHKLKEDIEGISGRNAMSVTDAERDLIINFRIAIPFPEPRPPHDAQYKLEYRKPANINVIGSYPIELMSRTNKTLAIDMLVTMPASLFQEKDYVNYRYFYKRAYYIACIAAGLRKSDLNLEMHFDNFSGNPLQPILIVKPTADAAVRTKQRAWQINIIPGLPSKTFAPERLLPDRNAVRPRKQEIDEEMSASLSPTAFYNSSVQSDSQHTAYLKLVHSASARCESFRDACLLGRVWLHQRGWTSHITDGGFGNFEWAALIAVLLSSGGSGGGPALSPGYSSYQLFKATLQYIAVRDLLKQPALLQMGTTNFASTGEEPIFFDGQRKHNLLFKMTYWSYQNLRSEARTSLSMLSDPLFDQFENAFILREDVTHLRHDIHFAIPTQHLLLESQADHMSLQLHKKLYSVLSRGLGDRITSISVHTNASNSWELASARHPLYSQGQTVLAIGINATTASRAVDHGPSAENKKEAVEFRRFWGDKAELRRFKDGSILESLVWANKEGSPSIVHQIIAYLIGRHFGAAALGDLVPHGDDFCRLIKYSAGGITAFSTVHDAYTSMEQEIRAMEDLPLSIRQIVAADTQLRNSSVDIPLTPLSAVSMVPADVVVQFESSARWPDDLVAAQRVKIAFLVKMSELFAANSSDTTSRVGLENTETEMMNQAYLDVAYVNGASFRIRIHHDREQALVERILKDKTSDPKTRESAAGALAEYRRRFVRAPAHTQAVQKLCTRFPALSPSIRLTKHWFASHLLANHFSEELIELFVIRVFTQPWPWQAPSSMKTGFLRTLAFISRWDWKSEPLIVDMGGDLKAPDIQALNTRFEAWRKLDPAMNIVVLFAASSVDPDGTTWTDGGLSKVAAGRMSALAKAATQQVIDEGLSLEPTELFASPLSDYDFVLYLTKDSRKAKTSQYKNLSAEQVVKPEMLGLSTSQLFLDELDTMYGQALMLFSGGAKSKVIAGLWSPFTSRRSWKVNLAYSTKPLTSKTPDAAETEINKDSILNEIARLGGDLIEKIDVHR